MRYAMQFTEPAEAFAHALHPQSAIGIQENALGPIIIEKGEHLIAEFSSQFGFGCHDE
jgi:hypothetical protein